MSRLSLVLALLLAACASSPPPLPDPHPRVPINRTAPPAMPGGSHADPVGAGALGGAP